MMLVIKFSKFSVEDNNISDLQHSDLYSPRDLPTIRDVLQGIQHLFFNVSTWDMQPNETRYSRPYLNKNNKCLGSTIGIPYTFSTNEDVDDTKAYLKHPKDTPKIP